MRIAGRAGSIDHPASYLRAAVVNECRSQHRRQARSVVSILAGNNELPYELLETRDALGALSPRQRAAVVLRYFVDVRDDEIARILGCRPSTVISAGIIIDLGDAASAIQTPVVGIATFERLRGGEQTEVDEQAGSIVVVSGGWYMHLNIYDEITDALGPGASTIVFDSIVASEQVDDSGLPSFELRAPLRWATDTEIPLQMMVQYSRFVVRRGCSDLAVSCSPDLSLEVVPSDQVFAPSSAWLGNAVEITSRPPN